MKESVYLQSKEDEDLETRFKKFTATCKKNTLLTALNPDDPDYWAKYTNILKSIKNDNKK